MIDAIMLDSGDAKVYYGRGVAHYNKRDWTKALIGFSRGFYWA